MSTYGCLLNPVLAYRIPKRRPWIFEPFMLAAAYGVQYSDATGFAGIPNPRNQWKESR